MYNVLAKLRIEEFYLLDTEKIIKEFAQNLRIPSGNDSKHSDSHDDMLKKLNILQDPQFRRLGSTIDLNSAVEIFSHQR